MRVLGKPTVLVVAAFVVATMSETARADILPAVGSPTVTAVNGGFNWTYDITLTANEQLVAGDFFTIYDFGPGTVVSIPTSWVASSDAFAPTIGQAAMGTATPTQEAATNYTFTWTGGLLTGQTDLGNFVLFSTTGGSETRAFMGRGSDPITNLKNANITNTLAPVTGPEPGTVVLLGTGLIALAGFARRTRRLS
jgi:hypothetical protein